MMSRTYPERPANMGVFGTSTGGGMTLALVQRIKEEKQPLPAAIAPGTPWSDLTETGDSVVERRGPFVCPWAGSEGSASVAGLRRFSRRKLREAGVEAALEIYEGQSHGQYLADTTAPESQSQEAFEEIAAFFDRHLGR